MLSKRIFDLIASLMGLLVLLPVLLVITILIKLNMPGPVFFKQGRGQHGKLFPLVKFRTMSVNHRGSTRVVEENRTNCKK